MNIVIIIYIFILFSSETASLILKPTWNELPLAIKNEFIETVTKIKLTMETTKCHSDAVKMSMCFLLIVKNPWDHAYIPKTDDETDPTKEQSNVLKYLTY